MTLPTDDGGAVDPRLARILLDYREAIAQATEKAYRDLETMGLWSPDDPRDEVPSEPVP